MSRSLAMVLGLVFVAAACSRTGDQLPIDVNEGAGGDGGAPTAGAGPTSGGPTSGSTSGQGPGSTTTSTTSSNMTTSSSSGSTTSATTSTGGPADCVFCIIDQCPEVQMCITDPACAQGLGCVVTDCGIGGTPDFQCVLGCFDGDLGAALDALQAVGCIFGTCGDVCSGFIPQGA